MTQQLPSRPVAGILWMIFTGLCFVGVTALVKLLGDRVPPEQSAFLRYVFGLVFLIPMIRPILRTRITPKLHALFAFRGMLHAIGVMLWFYAMTRISLAEVTAMNYLSPIYITLGAALFLGEPLAFRRIAAIGAAFLGALVILRPGFRELDPGHIAMLVTGLVFGGSYLLVRFTVTRTNPAVVVGMLSIWVTLGLAPFAWAVWVTPSLSDLVILFGVACFATAGHYAMTLALQAAPVSVTQPVTFLQLIWATALGVIAFGEAIDGWVLFGGGMIMAAVSFIAWREARLRRQASVETPVRAGT